MGSEKRVQKLCENGHSCKKSLDPGGPLEQEDRLLRTDSKDSTDSTDSLEARKGGSDMLSVPSCTVADIASYNIMW